MNLKFYKIYVENKLIMYVVKFFSYIKGSNNIDLVLFLCLRVVNWVSDNFSFRFILDGM